MDFSLPSYAESQINSEISMYLSKSEDANKLTQLLKSLSTEEALLVGFLVLPFLLVGWNAVLRIYDVKSTLRQISMFFLVIVFSALVAFLKYSGEITIEDVATKDKVAYYMAYNCLQQASIDSLCNHMDVNEALLLRLTNFESKSFAIIKGKLHIIDAELISIVKNRLEELLNIIEASNPDNISVDSIIQYASNRNVGNLSAQTIKNEIESRSGKLKYLESSTGDLITIAP